MPGQTRKGSKHTTQRRRNRDNRSAYSAPGVTPPAGNYPGIVFVPSAAAAIQKFLHSSEANTPAQASAAPNKESPKKPSITILKRVPSLQLKEIVVTGSSGEMLLKDIMKEIVNNPLNQKEETPDESPIISPPLNHDISYHPFGSKVFVNYWKAPALPAEDKKWPDFSVKNNNILNTPFLERSDMFPDELFEHMNAKSPTPVKTEPETKVTAPSRAFKLQPLVNPLLQKPSRPSPKKSSEMIRRARSSSWKPPPAFIPGVPFQSTKCGSDENLPLLNSGRERGNIQGSSVQAAGGDRGNTHGSSMQMSGINPDLRHTNLPAQVVQTYPYPESYFNPPVPGTSRGPMIFKPAEVSNSAIMQLPPSTSRAQSMLTTRASNQGFQSEPRVSVNQDLNNDMRYPVQVSSVYYPTLLQPQDSVNSSLDHNLHHVSVAGNPTLRSSRHRAASLNAPQLLHSPRGVYIRGLPSNITSSQLFANIRGGAIDSLTIYPVDENKIDAAVFFISSESAKAYKQFTNNVGGIWWNPKEHPTSFPSFVAFIGPECCGYDRLPEAVRRSIEREGATRCIVAYGVPEVLCTDGILQRLQRALYPHQVDIESYRDTVAVVTALGVEKKRATLLKFTSISVALAARKYFLETSMFQGVIIHFAHDECAGPISELSTKWNKQLHASNVMRPSRRDLHGEFALGMNEMAGRIDGTGVMGRRY